MTCPFSILGIAPTLDEGAIRRAYFTAASKAPPHADPEAFQRIRAAFDELADRSRRAHAFLSAPVDTEALVAKDRERIAAARAAHQRASRAAVFAAGAASRTLAESIEYFRPTAEKG